MSKLNTNSNAYTIIYAAVIVIIVAFLLAFVSSSLKPTQDANVAKDKKKQILASLNLRNLTDVEGTYAQVITADIIYGATAEEITNDGLSANDAGEHVNGAFLVEGKNISATNRPLYVATVEGETKYVIPVTGAGLWGGIWGYIAINDDGETIFGTYFSHESETAGLGALINEVPFQESFIGKSLHAEGSEDIALSVVKKGNEGTLSPDNYVNGITGATLTSNGVNDMLKKGIGAYTDILNSYKQ